MKDEQTPIISVMEHLPLNKFESYMEVTRNGLVADALSRSDFYRNNAGESLEPLVFDMMCQKASDFGISIESIRRTPKQHFPDIMAQDYYGVEVKSTKNNSWSSTGSSIVESLRDEYASKIYIMFGKLSAKSIDFRCKPYEQCLNDISVTHSPRYQIDMDLKEGEKTIFDKMNVPYDTFRQSPDQIEIVKDYYRKRYAGNGKEMPWWIGDDNSDTDNDGRLTRSTVKLWSGLDAESINLLKMRAYVLFPEVLGVEQTKYQRLALWLCSRHGVVSPNIRDSFTAGGQLALVIDDRRVCERVPRVLINFLKNMPQIIDVFEKHTDVYSEIPLYASYSANAKGSYYECWRKLVVTNLKATIGGSDFPLDDIFNMRFVGERSGEAKVEILETATII